MNIISQQLQGNFDQEYIDHLRSFPIGADYTRFYLHFMNIHTPEFEIHSDNRKGIPSRLIFRCDFILFKDIETGLYFVTKNRLTGERGWYSEEEVLSWVSSFYSNNIKF